MDAFIKKIILRSSIQAAFQRGSVYAVNISTGERDLLKESIKRELEEFTESYSITVSEANHIENIKQLSRRITQEHEGVLRDGELRIGTAQKLLNVYIKFLWCLNEATQPEHCPINGIVLRKIRVNNCSWTKLGRLRRLTFSVILYMVPNP